jgi:hypothetical protein
MTKQEKYIEFVVKDLVKHVKVSDGISFYFFGEYRVEATPFRLTAFYPNWRDVFYGFGDMVIKRYGVHNDEVGVIWRRLKVVLNEKYYDSPDGSI